MGLKTGIWATRLEFGPRDWDLRWGGGGCHSGVGRSYVIAGSCCVSCNLNGRCANVVFCLCVCLCGCGSGGRCGRAGDVLGVHVLC